jgi:hypothetical protein
MGLQVSPGTIESISSLSAKSKRDYLILLKLFSSTLSKVSFIDFLQIRVGFSYSSELNISIKSSLYESIVIIRGRGRYLRNTDLDTSCFTSCECDDKNVSYCEIIFEESP